MTIALKRVACAAALAWAASASAQLPPAAPADVARLQAEADKLPDTPGDGPYRATMEVDARLPGYVVYRPADLAPFARAGGKLGLLVWGNGACAADGSSARQHLAEIASYGYLVIAPGKWQSGPNARDPRGAPAPPPARAATAGPPAKSPTSASDLARALDWALSARGAYGKLIDRNAVALGGYSCGGLQALRLAANPRIHALLIENSGIFVGGSSGLAEMDMPKDQLQAIHTPVLYLLGGETDIAYANGSDDFARIGQVPAIMVNIPTGHGGTYNQPMGGKAAGIVVDWLQWQLRGDNSAARTFTGANCRLCTDSGAKITAKHLTGPPAR
ncbi:MAG: hypothetical protein ABIP41_05075 [Croceibacterium sp.]